MSVLLFIEPSEGEIKKSSLEAAFFASSLAQKLNVEAIAISLSNSPDSLSSIGAYGIKKVFQVSDTKLKNSSSIPYAQAVSQLAKAQNAQVVLFPKSTFTDSLISRVATALNASVATNVCELPDLSNGFKVKRAIYTGKAFAHLELNGAVKVISVAKNSCAGEIVNTLAEVISFAPSLSESDFKVQQLEVEKATGDILLTEADIVVSGGRGLKGPENWGVILDLAKSIKAGTGCSKPVSDMDWRPHHEHVGQTGVKVSPNLYIAVGISGAIQHLAGVNSSKVIVVINKDPEAPFFKAADYGICGDLFEVLPKLTAAAKNYF
jgi:electron transfer flavoprotein alpha subunit